MMKRILAATLCLIMLLALLPKTARAFGTKVWISEKELTSTNPYYHNDGTVNSIAEGANASFDASKNILTLTDLNVNAITPFDADRTCAIRINGDIEIVLNGNSNVTILNADFFIITSQYMSTMAT